MNATKKLLLSTTILLMSAQVKAQVFDGLKLEMEKACPIIWEDLGLPINSSPIQGDVWQGNSADLTAFTTQYIQNHAVTQAEANQVAATASAVASVCGSFRMALIDTLTANNSLDTTLAAITAANPDAISVQLGAPAASLVIAPNGNVGVGAVTPASSLHIRRTDGTSKLQIEDASQTSAAREMLKLKNNGGSYMTFSNTATNENWYLTHENASSGKFIIADGVNDGPELSLSSSGSLIAQGAVTASDIIVHDPSSVVDSNPSVKLTDDNQSWDIQLKTASDRFVIKNDTAGVAPLKIDKLATNNLLRLGANAGNSGVDIQGQLFIDSKSTNAVVIPEAAMHIHNGGTPFTGNVYADVIVQDSAAPTDIAMISLISGSASNAQLTFGSESNQFGGQVIYNNASKEMNFNIDGIKKLSIGQAGLTATQAVHVKSTGASNTELTLENSLREWKVRNNTIGNFVINTPGDSGFELELNESGDLHIEGTLTTAGTTCGGGCDAVFTPEYPLPSIDDHAAAMWQNKYLPNVGPTIENEPINVSDKLGRMLNELETAHIYIAKLHEDANNSKQQLSHLSNVIGALEKRLNELEK